MPKQIGQSAKRTVEEALNVIFDPQFADVKEEAFCQWMLEAVDARSKEGQLCGGDCLRKAVLRQLHLPATWERDRAPGLQNQYENALRMLLQNGWLQVRFDTGIPAKTEDGEVPADASRTYILTDAGRQRLDTVAGVRQESFHQAYYAFCDEVMLGAGEQEGEQGGGDASAAAVAAALQRSISWERLKSEDDVDGLFTPGLQLEDIVRDYFRRMEPAVCDALMVPAGGSADAEELAGSTVPVLETAFRVSAFASDEGARTLRHGLQAGHLAVCSTSDGKGPLALWFYRCGAERMISKVLPYDQNIKDALAYDTLKSVTVYLDTNVLIGVLSSSDKHHRRALQIMRFFEKQGMPFVWGAETEHEFRRTLDFAGRLVAFLRPQFPHDRVRVVQDVEELPSFVRTFYFEDWGNWEAYKSSVLSRYDALRKHSRKAALDRLLSEERYRRDWDESTKQMERLLALAGSKEPGSASKGNAHDARALAAVLVLRNNLPAEFIAAADVSRLSQPDAFLMTPFWFLTFDDKIRDMNSMETQMSIELPLALSFTALVSLYDPYALAAFVRQEVDSESVRARHTLTQTEIEKLFARAKAASRRSLGEMVREMNVVAAQASGTVGRTSER